MPPKRSNGRGQRSSNDGSWRRTRDNPSASTPSVRNTGPDSQVKPSGVSRNTDDPRNFEFVASVSRSSGLEKDGDTLKDHEVQVEYRAYIQDKLDAYWKRFPDDQRSEDVDIESHRKEVESNILIKLRKLREGVSSSKRIDDFATEVYETSLYLSILFHSNAQIPSISSHLLSKLYATQSNEATSWTTALLMLHALASHGTSQKHFYDARRDLLKKCHLESALDAWTLSLARSLHRHEATRFELLSRTHTVLPLFPKRQSLHGCGPDLAVAALEVLLCELRAQARRSAWTTFRKSYREFGPLARPWVARLLFFDVISPKERDAFDTWIVQSKQRGEIVEKEGVENHWMVKIK